LAAGSKGVVTRAAEQPINYPRMGYAYHLSMAYLVAGLEKPKPVPYRVTNDINSGSLALQWHCTNECNEKIDCRTQDELERLVF
jgi:hypothetical protein